MHTMATESRRQRKFKPIGCDFDGDVVRQERRGVVPHDRNPVCPVVSMRRVLQTFLVSVITLVTTKTVHDSCPCDICFRWVIHRAPKRTTAVSILLLLPN
ncbi:hypothetical protein AVEN_66492-1 [Araneus ventricosus]|uniref:Uncharacterized protein n=1 Tax=Araneus ventricosus TaxID=182803 RepID=A0A4Y2LFU6_ARAVE|nr:hypothetical protein AVEN_66492-1 [Araneus ventricosus]